MILCPTLIQSKAGIEMVTFQRISSQDQAESASMIKILSSDTGESDEEGPHRVQGPSVNSGTTLLYLVGLELIRSEGSHNNSHDHDRLDKSTAT